MPQAVNLTAVNGKDMSYFLSCILIPVEVWCENSLCDSLESFLIGLFNSRNWGKAFDKTTVLVLDTICSVLADLMNERDRIHRLPCLEKDHCQSQTSVLRSQWSEIHLQHCVSSFTEVKRGFTDGLRMSASSLLISSSMSPPTSESSSSALVVPLAACSPYNFAAYFRSVSSGLPQTETADDQVAQKEDVLLGKDRADLQQSVLLSSWRRSPRCPHHQG